MNAKLEGSSLQKRRRAIVANAIYQDRLATGVAHLPMTDHEAGIQEMMYSLLTKMQGTESAAEENAIVPAHQPVTRPQLINVEKMLNDIAEEPIEPRRAKA